MAGLGVDEINVKPLLEHDDLAPVRGHAHDFRGEEEREILARARKIADAAGLTLWIHPELISAESPPIQRPATPVPVAEFAGIGEKIPHAGKAEKVWTTPIVQPELTLRQAHDFLELVPAEKSGFSCSQPFQTLFVNQEGAVRPCCFWASESPALGTVAKSTALEIWRGPGYHAVRNGVAQGDYSDSGCGSCLKSGIAPPENNPWVTIHDYLDWHASRFGDSPLAAFREAKELQLSCRWGIDRLRTSAPELMPAITASVTHRKNLAFDQEFQGEVNDLSDGYLWGWVWSFKRPEERVRLRILHGDRVVRDFFADTFRGDLKIAGKGDGAHAFAVDLGEDARIPLRELRAVIGESEVQVPFSVALRERSWQQ